ncbi:shikimate dehydrogenase [Treponema sp.]
MSSKTYKADLVGVFGHPVAENPTIVMIEAAFRAKKIDWRYLTIEVLPKDLAAAVQGLRAFNMRGINLTIPHKIEVMQHLDTIADDARLIGAVNTVVNKDGILRGENTDGKGFIASLLDLDPAAIKGADILLLGAGGAARAIAVELALHGAGSLRIANRTLAKAESLASLLNKETSCQAEAMAWNGMLKIHPAVSILVNATSIGLYPDIAEKPEIDYSTLRKDMIVCDVIPNPPRSAFLKEAEKHGARCLDGLGMLVNQGVIGFKHWTGLDAPADIMREALLKEFS